MIAWPAELGSSGPTSVNSIATNDNIPTRIELVRQQQKLSFIPIATQHFQVSSVPLCHFSMLLDCRKSMK